MSYYKPIDKKVLDNPKVILETFWNESFYVSRITQPRISDEKLLERYSKIKPIVKIDELFYYLRNYSLKEIRRCSYMWDVNYHKIGLVDMNDAKTIAEFKCYHNCVSISFYPSIADILQQFLDNALSEANAFYALGYHQGTSSEINIPFDSVINSNFQVSKVRALVLKR